MASEAIKTRMSDAELSLFTHAITGKNCAIEFGAGGSTYRLVDAGVGEILSVESDPQWIEMVTNHKFLQPHVASGRLTVHHADIGPTKGWGAPADKSSMKEWPHYWRDPWRHVEAERVDLVFVDGRFRVACTLNSILQGTRNMTIVIHDFWNRSRYHVLMKYLNCACRADTLGVFFPRDQIDTRNLAADLVNYAFVAD
jgi:hypothetical protein